MQKEMTGTLLVVYLLFYSVHATATMSAWDLHQSWKETTKSIAPIINRAFPYMSCFKSASKANDLPLPLLLAVARGESDFSPTVISKANAVGVMQIQWPGTAKDLGINKKQSLFDPCTNIEAGARYLKQMIDRYSDVNMALAAYNYGPGRIKTSMDWSSIPSGAKWYSEYIYDHYRYVTKNAIKNYKPSNKLTLAYFDEPYRAKAMTGYFHNKWPELTIDWFANNKGNFTVTASFDNETQRATYLPKLNRLGFK